MSAPNLNPQYYLTSVSTLSAQGTGYAVGNILTATGGTFATAATISVSTVNGTGAITSFLVGPGNYSVLPTNPITLSGGAGTGATLNGVWVAANPGSTTINLYGSNTPTTRPAAGTLERGEPFVNTAEGLLFVGDENGNPVAFGIDPQLALIYAIALG